MKIDANQSTPINTLVSFQFRGFRAVLGVFNIGDLGDTPLTVELPAVKRTLDAVIDNLIMCVLRERHIVSDNRKKERNIYIYSKADKKCQDPHQHHPTSPFSQKAQKEQEVEAEAEAEDKMFVTLPPTAKFAPKCKQKAS
jgi:hypothetical protein